MPAEELAGWLDAKGTSKEEEDRSQAHANRSAKSLRWLYENRGEYSAVGLLCTGTVWLWMDLWLKRSIPKQKLKVLRYRLLSSWRRESLCH